MRWHRTGRNVQFNAKITEETNARFYKIADEKGVVLGELLKLGVDAIEEIGPLERLAERHGVSVGEIVKRAIEALERAGG